MGLVRLTQPDPLVSPSGARAHLRIDGGHDDALLAGMLAAAADFVERETGTTLGLGTFRATFNGWPADGHLRMPRPPLHDVDEVRYATPGGGTGVLPPSSYVLDTASRPGRVVFTAPLPPLAAVPNAVQVEFRAGHPDEASAPPALLQAMKMVAGHWYENREAATDRRIDEVPLAVQRIIWQHAMPEVP